MKHILGSKTIYTDNDLSLFFSDGLAAVKINGLYGYINKEGDVVIPCIYDFCNAFFNKTASVSKGGKYGIIDINGNTIIPCIYDGCGSFSEGLAAFKVDDKWGFVNLMGEEIIKPQYDNWQYFRNGVAKVGLFDFSRYSDNHIIVHNYNHLDLDFESLDDLDYDIEEYNETDFAWGFINNNGVEIIPCKFDISSEMGYDGIIRVRRTLLSPNKYYTKDGEQIDDFGDPSEGITKVKVNGKWGYINRFGDKLTDFIYDYCSDVSYGKAHVRIDDKILTINIS